MSSKKENPRIYYFTLNMPAEVAEELKYRLWQIKRRIGLNLCDVLYLLIKLAVKKELYLHPKFRDILEEIKRDYRKKK